MPQKKAEIILKVAQAIGTQLDMPELLAALKETLSPIIHFDAVSIVILDGDIVRVHWAHVDGLPCSAGETVESALKRLASSLNVDPVPMTLPVRTHPISII